MSNISKLEHLRAQLAEARGEHASCMRIQITAQRKTINAEKAVKALEAQVRSLEEKTNTEAPVVVTDHAVVRWLERHHGLDMDAVRATILDEGTEAAIKFVGTGKITKGDVALVVENRVVVTVKPIAKGHVTL
jgi:aspartate/methionine/tyrosine aminotransferase